jgi:hypothetical protein
MIRKETKQTLLDKDIFKNPPLDYAPVPFWSWNDELKDETLKQQIVKMMEQGWGGFFMHARAGLKTPYLSREWMQRVKTCVSTARELGMNAWLYDEDKWPSGFAGGRVPLKGPYYRMKFLVCLSDSTPLSHHEARYEDNRFTELKRVRPNNAGRKGNTQSASETSGAKTNPLPSHSLSLPENGPETVAEFENRETRLSFYVVTAPLGDPWFNGASYVDLLNPEVTDAFIRSTYEAYRDEIGTAFGYTVPGIFTDEPCYDAGLFHGEAARNIPWTPALPRIFFERYGYDLLDHLPSLIFDVGEFRKVRYHFWSLFTDLFVKNFTRRLFDWCERYQMKLTGHFLEEDTLRGQVERIGSAMPHYEVMQQPGIDFLFRDVGYIGEKLPGRNLHSAGILTVKQCTSVAHQLGKKRTLSELYGGSGQDLGFEDRRRIADWHLVHGVNFLNPHLSLYSMRGERKRDWPPNLFYQQPWWPYTHFVENYATRLCYALSQGERQTSVLVLHPIASAWMSYRPGGSPNLESLQEDLVRISAWLLGSPIDFDYGDEGILAKYGAVSDGRLQIGKRTYSTVIIPPSETWASGTYKTLKSFMSHGGKVLAVKPLPRFLEGEENNEFAGWIAKLPHVACAETEFRKRIEAIHPPVIRLRDASGEPPRFVWTHWRKGDKGQDVLFLANVHRAESWEGTLRFPAKGRWEEWDALSGETRPLVSKNVKGGSEVTLSFSPAESHLFVRSAGDPCRRSARRAVSMKVRREIPLPDSWRVHRNDPNILVLDRCEYQIPGSPGVWSDPVPIFRAERDFKKAADSGLWKSAGEDYRIAYSFDVAYVPSKKEALSLAIELSGEPNVKVNDKTVSGKGSSFWLDPGWTLLDLTGKLREGTNRIEAIGRWREDVELEAAYVLGKFSVRHEDRRRFRIERESRKPAGGDLVDGGYQFFTGEMTLTQEIDIPAAPGPRVTIDFEELGATVLGVTVNGEDAGCLFWRPYSLEITDLLKPGTNTIALKLVTSLVNLLGPHHRRCGDPGKVGPWAFSDLENWSDTYHLVRLGPTGARITVRS